MTEHTEKPRRRADVVLRELGSEAMLYDPRADRVVRLNATSRVIWECCDGTQDAAAIAERLAAAFEGPGPAELDSDVRSTLRTFLHAGLLE